MFKGSLKLTCLPSKGLMLLLFYFSTSYPLFHEFFLWDFILIAYYRFAVPSRVCWASVLNSVCWAECAEQCDEQSVLSRVCLAVCAEQNVLHCVLSGVCWAECDEQSVLSRVCLAVCAEHIVLTTVCLAECAEQSVLSREWWAEASNGLYIRARVEFGENVSVGVKHRCVSEEKPLVSGKTSSHRDTEHLHPAAASIVQYPLVTEQQHQTK